MIDHTQTIILQLAEIKKIRATRNNTRLRKSKLDPFRGELVTMQANGASIADLVLWLKRYHRLSMCAPAISARLKIWRAELEAEKNAPRTGESVAQGELLTAWRIKTEKQPRCT